MSEALLQVLGALWWVPLPFVIGKAIVKVAKAWAKSRDQL